MAMRTVSVNPAICRTSYPTVSSVAARIPRRAYTTGEAQDVVVIGGGPGGYVAAIKAAQLGLKTTCVEKRATLGGTCLNVGCIPSKALLNSSHLYHTALHDFAKYGIRLPSAPEVDLPGMMKQKDTAVKRLTGGIEGLFRKYKVNWAKGLGTVTGPNEVTVTSETGSKSKISTKNIVLATGSDVATLPGINIDEKTIVSSTGALALPSIPKRLAVIGGGIIGLEMGSVWKRLGSDVTVIEFTDKITGGADGQVATEMKKILEKQGLKFKLNSKVTGVKSAAGVHTLAIEPAKGGAGESLEADVVLVAVGRKAFTDQLGLKELGVKMDNRGRVEIDHHFRTNIPSIRAIGDTVKGPMLAHKAEDEGIAVAELIAGKAGHVNYDAIPFVLYTDPEVAWVGQTEEELKTKNIPYRAGVFTFMANSRARTVDTTAGFVKMLAHKDTDRLLGAHIIGPYAGELIAECVLGIEYGASTEDIARTSHAHPTLSEALREAAMATHGLPIHS